MDNPQQPPLPPLPEGAFIPPWKSGQRWQVDYTLEHFNYYGANNPPQTFRPEVVQYRVEVAEDGIVRIETRADPQKHPDPHERAVLIAAFSPHGELLGLKQWGTTPKEDKNIKRITAPVPGEPHLTIETHGEMFPPWWPLFPLVPGTEQSFRDGALHQKVEKNDEGILVITVTRHDEERSYVRTMTLLWDPKDPWWSSMRVEYNPPLWPHWSPLDIEGRVARWGLPGLPADGASSP